MTTTVDLVSVDITEVEMTVAEESRLLELEHIVEAGMETFNEVGRALAEIQASKLYRATHATFEAYLRVQFDLSSTRAYELIRAADTIEALSSIEDAPLPINVGQARELAGVPAEVAATVMRAAADSGKMTAASIRGKRQEIVPVHTTALARRPDLTKTVPRTGLEVRRLADRIAKLCADDRFDRNADALRRALYAEVEYAISVYQPLLERLGLRPSAPPTP